MNASATLINAQQAAVALKALWDKVKPWVVAGHRLRVTIKKEQRSDAQNDRFHAMLDDVAKQAIYLGQKRSKDFWKGLFVSGWEIATGKKPEIVPGLEGEFVNIRGSTRDLSVSHMASVMEYIEAWGAMNGVKFSAPERDLQ